VAYQKSLLSSSFLAQAKSEYLEESKLVLPVQINGKTRGTILVDKSCSEDDVFQIAASDSPNILLERASGREYTCLEGS
jgi:leucyl-tRNA synthetase